MVDFGSHTPELSLKDLLNVVSKFLNMGMSVAEAILRSTWNPARETQRPDLGHLSVGAAADVAILRLRQGEFGFIDAGGDRMRGNQRLECELTIRGGEVVWDLNGISRPGWTNAPPNELIPPSPVTGAKGRNSHAGRLQSARVAIP